MTIKTYSTATNHLNDQFGCKLKRCVVVFFNFWPNSLYGQSLSISGKKTSLPLFTLNKLGFVLNATFHIINDAFAEAPISYHATVAAMAFDRYCESPPHILNKSNSHRRDESDNRSNCHNAFSFSIGAIVNSGFEEHQISLITFPPNYYGYLHRRWLDC